MLTFEISGAQIDGARDYQEDAFLITHLGDSDSEGGSLVIVADGMGGHAAGNVASNMAVQTFNKHVTSNFPNESLANVLRESVQQANNSISETVRETAALKGMGCTLVAAVLEDKFIRWVSVGDSHLYLIRNGELSKQNADHSYGGFLDRMAAEGTPVEPEAGFSRNMLMSALTGEEIAEIDCPDEPLGLNVGDRIIVASDGLDTLSAGKVLSFSSENKSSKECVDSLLQGVEEANMPRQDNTTVVIIDVGEKEELSIQVAEPTAPITQAADNFDSGRGADSRPRPISALDEAPRRGKTGLIAVVGLLLIAGIAGAAYWFMAKTPTQDIVENTEFSDTELIDEDDIVVVDEDDPSTEEDDDETPIVAPVEPVAPIQPAAPVGETFYDKLSAGGNAPKMIWIAPGEFQMGSRESGANFDERPQRKVALSSFAMSVTEVTIADYNKFARATSRRTPKSGDLDTTAYPVFFVSWNDAVAYTQWLSTQTSQTYRLPSEAEWEYAARAGTDTAYAWGRRLGADNAHCFACETGLDPRMPTRTERFKPNAFGLFDMAGNVEEWVYDCYNKDYSGAPTDGSIFNGGDCSVRVVRGGAFSSGPKALRSSSRSKFRFDKGNDSIGIRIARDP